MRGAAVVGVLASAFLAACSLLIDTSGLSGGPGTPDGGGPTGDGATSSGNSVDGSSGGGADSASGGPVPEGGSSSGDAMADGPCTIPFVQAVPGTTAYQVIQQSPTHAVMINAAAGNLLVAIAYGGQSPGSSSPHTTDPNMTFDVRDSQGNTYYAGPLVENATSNQSAIQIFYAPNVVGGATQVTATSTAPSGIALWTGLFVHEYSGVAATDAVDISVGRSAASSSLAISPGSMTTSRCSLVVGAFVDGHVDGQNLTPGDGWIFRSTDDWDPGAAVDSAPKGVPPGTPVNALMNLTSGADNGWVATQMAFRGAATSPLPQPTKVAFANAPMTIKASTCSAAVSIVTEDSSSAALATSTGVRLALSGPGAGFFADAACAYPMTSALIGAGTSSASLYVKPTVAGTTVTLTATPANGLAAVSQVETITP